MQHLTEAADDPLYPVRSQDPELAVSKCTVFDDTGRVAEVQSIVWMDEAGVEVEAGRYGRVDSEYLVEACRPRERGRTDTPVPGAGSGLLFEQRHKALHMFAWECHLVGSMPIRGYGGT